MNTNPYWPTSLSRRGLQRNSPLVRACVLGLIDIVSIGIAWLVIVPWSGPGFSAQSLAALGSIVLLQIIVGASLSLYRNRFPIGSGLELRRQGIAAFIVTSLSVGVSVLLHPSIDLSWWLLAVLSAQVLMISCRQGLRMWIDDQRRPMAAEPVVVVGAGQVGVSLISQMLRDPSGRYLPVALIDDDPSKAQVVIDGVHVRGRLRDVQTVVDEVGATGVIVAIAQASAQLFSDLALHLDLSQTWVRTVPALADLLSEDVELSVLRDLDVADIIGRSAIDPETIPIDGLVRGRTVLVTGAGGSIGSELCRLVAKHSPRRLVMLDRDESALHSLCMSMNGRALMDSPDLVLCDIRDYPAVLSAFEEHRPDLVFHAAALKHLPMLERYPDEGWKTNVHGSLNVLRASQATDVAQVVNISTDKAANPCSELGRSKFLAEHLTSYFAGVTGRPHVSVRFGNVLGSRGSVLVSFADQIRRGGPVTVTDENVSRYFMTIPEACLLVLQAAMEGDPGDTMVLDMGEPVRILDIATRMMTLAGRTCPIEFTGLRDGEKLHEELFAPAEGESPTDSGTAWHVRVGALDPGRLPGPDAARATIARAYVELIGEVAPPAPAVGPTVPVASRDGYVDRSAALPPTDHDVAPAVDARALTSAAAERGAE